MHRLGAAVEIVRIDDQRLAERDAHFLDRVVVVNMQVALGADRLFQKFDKECQQELLSINHKFNDIWFSAM